MQKFILIILILKMSSCQRRITNGSRVPDHADSSFMVYIIGARVIDGIPGWLCGGCIIHPMVVLTSAACLSESRIKHMFVIAGYKMYVSTVKIDQDPCTKHMKKRIVSVCKHGQFHSEMWDKYFMDRPSLRWTKLDIGIAKLDSPIDFFDNDYLKYCSYLPNSIKINFNTKYHKASADLVTYGWGHSTYYRPDGDLHDYNEPFLMYASSKILDAEECRTSYDYKNFTYLYDRIVDSVFCTHGIGNLDASGKERDPPKPIMIACSANYTRKTGKDMEIKNNTIHGTCSQNKNLGKTNNSQDDLIGATRRNGICQNDHGSPAVLWIGGKQYVAGVATAFRVNKQMECKGPSMYTNIKCSSKFLYCILNELKVTYTRKFGSSCIKAGAVLEDTELDWEDYENI